MIQKTVQSMLVMAMLAPALNVFAQSSEPKSRVVLASDIVWEQLNPARGDASPKAATLWGDRKGKEATGFLVKFADGFSSPPHIHNVSYRGVVIAGDIHNDDPDANPMWMPTGSFWTQPAGEVHITSSRGAGTIFFVKPTKDALYTFARSAASRFNPIRSRAQIRTATYFNKRQKNESNDS